MNDVLVRFGCAVVGGVGATMSVPGSFDAAEQSAVALGCDLVHACKAKRTYPGQDAVHAAVRERFKRLVEFNKDSWPYEYSCWRSQGWL